MCDGDCKANEDRRSFLVGSAAALTGLAVWGARAYAQDSPPPTRVLDDPSITMGSVTFRSGEETIDGFLAQPKAAGKHRAVIVVAGNRITEEYIPNTCAALAVAGYVGLAPNIYHTVPDDARTVQEMNKALEGRSEDDFLRDVAGGAAFLKAHDRVRQGGIGILGFCAGGRRAMLYAARFPEEVRAVIPFHPGKTTAAEIVGLTAPVEIHSGTADRSVPVADIRELAGALKAQGTRVKVYLYEGADHGFLAYTRPTYRPDDAQTAWKRTVKFLRRDL